MAKDKSGEPGDRNMSKASVEAAVQAAFALCATCSHERGAHPEDRACSKTWRGGTEDESIDVRCRCAEYWPERFEFADGMAIRKYAVTLGGAQPLALDRRLTSEFWDGLRQGTDVVVLARFRVSGKGYREKDFALTETRKLGLAQMYFLRAKEFEELLDRNVVLDAFGNEVDPETGEILEPGE